MHFFLFWGGGGTKIGSKPLATKRNSTKNSLCFRAILIWRKWFEKVVGRRCGGVAINVGWSRDGGMGEVGGAKGGLLLL